MFMKLYTKTAWLRTPFALEKIQLHWKDATITVGEHLVSMFAWLVAGLLGWLTAGLAGCLGG